MFMNYLLVALRNQRNQPGFTAIKVLSLALGLICSILVLMHVQYTYSYDKHFDNWQNIYRLVASITTDQRIDSNMIADGQFDFIQQDYAQVTQAAKIQPGSGLFAYGDVGIPDDYLWADPEILSIFSFDFLQGDRQTALNEPNTIIMSETFARRYFGNEDPMGKTLVLENYVNLRVTGVFRDLPPNTHMEFEALLSVETARQISGEAFMKNGSWGGYSATQAFLVIPDASAAEALRQDLPAYIDRHAPEQMKPFLEELELALDIEPLASLHLSPRQGFSAPDNSRRIILAGLVTFAVLILLSSCINFANLSLTQMQQRGKEIGVRKSMGAKKSDLLAQFLIESMLLTLIAMLASLPIIYFAVGPYTALTNTAFTFGQMLQSSQALWIVAFVLLVGIVSGLIPALRMARFEPSAAINGKRDGGRSSKLVRSGLTVVQFSFAVVLVILAIGVTLQVRYLNEVDIGFNRSNLVILDSMYNPRNPEQFNYDAMVNELMQHPGIVTIGKSESLPPNNGGYNPWRRADWAADDTRTASHLGVNEHYVPAMQLQLLAGRNFSRDFPADFMPAGQPQPDVTYGVLITPAAVRNFELGSSEDAIDKLLAIGNLTFRVVGVVDDFRLSGGIEDLLRSTTILRAVDAPMRALLVRIDPLQRESALAHIDAVWARHRPDAPINREFYEQNYSQLIYERTNGINRAAQFAALITTVIAALGLYALAYYSTERRTKEIGVRKVLGASARSIVRLLTVDFLKPVVLACVIAAIGAWFLTGYYFSQFSARADLPLLLYVGVIAATVMLAILTVAGQCYRTSRSDPVSSLRSE